MTNELRERVARMKEDAIAAVHEQFCGILNECQAPVIVSIATRALIAEVERLTDENAMLKDFIVEHHGTEPPIVAAIEDDD